MRVLLDSHIFLWSATGSSQISIALQDRIVEAEQVYVSLASEWELTIKEHNGKLQAPARVGDIFDRYLHATTVQVLEIERSHFRRLAQLPLHHRDPFDRLLIAQALEEDLTVVTSDRIFARYGVKLLPLR